MKRTQIILEEWQPTWLAEEAERQSVSMSALLRQLLTEAIERRQTQGWQAFSFDQHFTQMGLVRVP